MKYTKKPNKQFTINYISNQYRDIVSKICEITGLSLYELKEDHIIANMLVFDKDPNNNIFGKQFDFQAESLFGESFHFISLKSHNFRVHLFPKHFRQAGI